jgi:hypothetical protein
MSDELDVKVKPVGEEPETEEAEGEPEEEPEEKDSGLDPLFASDSRFQTLTKDISRQLNNKFIKLFKRTPDLAKRNAGQEMALFMAHFTFSYLKGLFEQMLSAGDRNAVAATFGEFERLYSIMRQQSGIAKVAERLEQIGKEHDARVREESVPETGSPDVPDGQGEGDVHDQPDEVSVEQGHDENTQRDGVAEGSDD